MDSKFNINNNQKQTTLILIGLIVIGIGLLSIIFIRSFSTSKKAEQPNCANVEGRCFVNDSAGGYDDYRLIVKKGDTLSVTGAIIVTGAINVNSISFKAVAPPAEYLCIIEQIEKKCGKIVNLNSPLCYNIPDTVTGDIIMTDTPIPPSPTIYFPSATPIPSATRIPSLTPIPTNTPSPIPTITPSPIPSDTPEPTPTIPNICPQQKMDLFESVQVMILCPGCACTGQTCEQTSDCNSIGNDFICVGFANGSTECIRDSAQEYCARLRNTSYVSDK